MQNWVSYQNGNYKVNLDLTTGTKIRENDEDYFDAEFPESADVKVTNRCSNGCSFCHEGSIKDGKHSDALHSPVWESFHPYTEIACLSGNTVVHGENGSVDIKDLKVGDKIFDSTNTLATVIHIAESNKQPYRIKGQRGFNVVCSADHPFICNGVQIKAENLLNQSVDMIKLAESIDQSYFLDFSPLMKEANPIFKTSRGGKLFDDGTIRLRNCTPRIPSKIEVTKELMYIYGLFVAEGDSKGYTLNINETDFAQKISDYWENVLGLKVSVTTNPEKHSMHVGTRPSTMNQDLFFNLMSCGKGARNKNLSYLYKIQNKELIRWALIGLIDGDGCFRKRLDKKKNPDYSFSLKTTSKKLAYDFSYLLKKWFGIKATVYYGWSKERKIENRILAKSDYYKVDVYGYDACVELFQDYYGELPQPISNFSSLRKEDRILSIEESEKETLYDITLAYGSSHVFPINGGWLTHNCGGGNLMEYPDLVPLLERLKTLKLIPNITVHQWDFEKNFDLIKKLSDEKLIYGLGVSLDKVTPEFIDKMKQFPNGVIHVINGIVTGVQLRALAHNDLKILILGYKTVRRGNKLYHSNVGYAIDRRKDLLYDNLEEILKENWFKVISFDNLAIKQLKPQRLVSEDYWNTCFMGDDGIDGQQTSASMYIDLVENEFARNSCDVDHRFKIEDKTVTEMYQFLKGLK